MIEVEFITNKKGHILKYTIKGHAGYDEYGKDIVCSAISVLAQTGLISLKNVCNINASYIVEDGYLEVDISQHQNNNNINKADIVMKTVFEGIKSTKEAYPNNITLKYGEV